MELFSIKIRCTFQLVSTIMTEYLIDFYNSSRQETYDIIPITTFALSPETDKVFSREDNYPERFFRWADKFINFIY